MLLILHQYPYTKFHEYYYEIDQLKKKLNEKVEVHDFSLFLNSIYINDAFLNKREKAKRFKSIFKWLKKFKNLKKKNLIVLNLTQNDNFYSFLINLVLKQSNIKVLKIVSRGVCSYLDDPNKSIYNNLFNKIIYSFKYPKTLIYFFKVNFFKLLFYFIHGNETLLISDKENIKKNNSKKVIKIHSLDYSKFLFFKKKKLIYNDYIVYLDKPGPYFRNDLNLQGHAAIKNIKEYYRDLNYYFDKLVSAFSVKIIIIPHPKNKGIVNPYFNRKFKLDHSLDAPLKLIKNSKFVISASASTALSYAVVYYKPIVLLFSNFENQLISTFKDKVYMSKILDLPLVNFNDKFLKKDFYIKINKQKYNKYKYKYLTPLKNSNETNHDIIINFLKLDRKD